MHAALSIGAHVLGASLGSWAAPTQAKDRQQVLRALLLELVVLACFAALWDHSGA